jgi:hypothetical protein
MSSELDGTLSADTSRYVVLHIPKTAGTSLNAILCTFFGKAAVSPPFDAREFHSSGMSNLSRFQVVQGHISWKEFRIYFQNAKTITFLRDPVDRCLSWYSYVRELELKEPLIPLSEIKYTNSPEEAISLAKQLAIVDFFRSDHPHIKQNVCNRQAYQLGDEIVLERREPDLDTVLTNAMKNLGAVGFVGLFEEFDNDVKRLSDWLGYEGKVPSVRSNVTKDRIRANDLPASMRSCLEKLNELDMELYESAKSLTHP